MIKPKTKKTKIIFFSSLAVVFIVSCALAITLLLLSRIDYQLVDNPTFEINTEHDIAALFSQVKAGTLENPDAKLDTQSVGEKSQKATFISQLGTKQSLDIVYRVIDTIAPEIIGESEFSFKTTDEVNLIEHFETTDNSGQQVALSVEGDYDLKKVGDYVVKIIAKDDSGNESNKEVTLKITEPPRPVVTAAKSTSSSTPYYVEVNRKQNVVIVYSKDQNNNYSNIVKVFVASTGAPGSETPLGTFTTSNKYETLYLVGNVWGHYTVRINGPIFFSFSAILHQGGALEQFRVSRIQQAR